MESLVVTYEVKRNELEKALWLDNVKSGVYKKRNVLSGIISLIFVFGVIYIVKLPFSFIGYLVCALSILCIMFLFLYQKRNDKQYIDKLDNNWTNFTLTVNPTQISIFDPKSIENQKRHYDMRFDGNLTIYETNEMFVYVFKAKTIFLTPKRVLDLDQIVWLHDIYSDNAKDNFFKLDNKTGKKN